MEIDVMDSKRYRIKYQNENLYIVVVTTDEGHPYEIFAEHSSNRRFELQYMLASWDCLTRFISMCLQTMPLEKIIKQLNRSTRQSTDLPGIILNILKTYEEVKEIENEKI
jgi:RNAse (barnase) inhibitor barstar